MFSFKLYNSLKSKLKKIINYKNKTKNLMKINQKFKNLSNIFKNYLKKKIKLSQKNFKKEKKN